MENKPVGKGIFLWQLPNNLDNLIQDLQSFDWVAVKIIDNIRPYNINQTYQFIEKYNKDIWTWGYTYGKDPKKEATETAKILNNLPKAKGFLIDAELEYKRKKKEAKVYAENLATFTDKPLGLCSYRFPNLHPEFPWKEFLEYCDFHAPQVYWIGDDRNFGPEIQTKNSIKQLQAVKNLPVIPVGIACKHPYNNKVWQPNPEQLKTFITYCKTNNLGYSFWEYKTAKENIYWWNIIK